MNWQSGKPYRRIYYDYYRNGSLSECMQEKLVKWYHKNRPEVDIDMSNVFVVWSCKTLQNYKCLVSTTISGDGIYAEYTFNGDKQEMYEDVYGKLTNTCITQE